MYCLILTGAGCPRDVILCFIQIRSYLGGDRILDLPPSFLDGMFFLLNLFTYMLLCHSSKLLEMV